ncbi:hypothetical protein K503DRAFT_833183 [Rhizopogon vinicolor AM-OR11-026]|uniref:Uncharacterized protein n=1 Tax=Rhizopogon vinicolor AM-OR11-026 TaxID=1314800 RepID=A0A1B7MPG3_9AGAM|nr:hypothetical protein K503DRAFT_833183 [Rhizopogon vinicolor AM-OR11-026]
MNPIPFSIYIPELIHDHDHPLYRFLESSLLAIMECEELLEAIARATLLNGDLLPVDDQGLVQRKVAIRNYLKDCPRRFEVQAIPRPPGTEYVGGETVKLGGSRSYIRLDESLASAWLRKERKPLISRFWNNYYLLSFALRIVILHELMHFIMFKFAVFPPNTLPPGTPPHITSPNRMASNAARGHGEAGYWVENWISGAGSARFVYASQQHNGTIDNDQLDSIHFVGVGGSYTELKSSDIKIIRPLAVGRLRPFPILPVHQNGHWAQTQGQRSHRFRAH